MPTENQNANLPATTDDADLAALQGAARNLMTAETALKFVKGKWKTYADKDAPEVVGNTESFAVDVLSYANGWVKWENKRPVHKYVFRPIDGWILPTKDKLPDRDERWWPLDKDGKRNDPWQETHKITVKNTATDEMFTWTTTSWYGRKALGKLIDAYVRDARKHPGKMPVVTLSSKDEPHPEYGDIPTPVFAVVDWQAFGEGAAPPGVPLKANPKITTLIADETADEIAVDESEVKEVGDQEIAMEEIPF